MSDPCQECEEPKKMAETCPGCGKHLCKQHNLPVNHDKGCTEYSNE